MQVVGIETEEDKAIACVDDRPAGAMRRRALVGIFRTPDGTDDGPVEDQIGDVEQQREEQDGRDGGGQGAEGVFLQPVRGRSDR